MTQGNSVTIEVPASSANVGLGFDIWSLGIAHPTLRVTCSRQPAAGVHIGDISSPVVPPPGRTLGHAGAVAADLLLRNHHVAEGIHLSFADDGYPVGGMGRSGAEAVGAVLAITVLYDLKLTRNEVILAAAAAEPSGHMDNVAGSTNGRFNVIASPFGSLSPVVDIYTAPHDLGIAIGYSSHQKAAGTAGARSVMEWAVAMERHVEQTGLISSATAAFVSGDIARFLELVRQDSIHEPRRASTGAYGSLTWEDLRVLKDDLFSQYQLALNISGAGPNIQLLYQTTEHLDGIPEAAVGLITDWFSNRGITMTIEPTTVAPQGAYDHAQRTYGLAG